MWQSAALTRHLHEKNVVLIVFHQQHCFQWVDSTMQESRQQAAKTGSDRRAGPLQIGSAAGSRRVNTAPVSGAFSHVNPPPIPCASFLAMLNPNPVEGSPPVGCAERRA